MKVDFKKLAVKYKSVIGFLLLCVIISFVTPRFLTVSNLRNVLTQVSVNAIIAIGMTFVILNNGIDLSVGSILAITGAIAAYLMKSTGNILISIVVALVVGTVIGVLNGLLITKGRLQAFIATLATMTIFRGVTYVFTNGNPISGLDENFTFLANNKLIGIPLPVVFMIIILVIAFYVLNETRFGRYLYALGGNEDSARLSGIATDKIRVLVYGISGFTAAVSAIIVTSRIGSASPNAGTGFELDAIAAVVLGGTSLSGGEGSVTGTIIGAMIIGVLNNGLNLMNVNPFYQSIVKGAVILLAVLLDKKEK
jgi:ribose transport system permease protein